MLCSKKSVCIVTLSSFSHVANSFDLELPIECDDEYWVAEDPENSFKQPPGLPSGISFFVWMIKLSNLGATALRRIVSCPRSCISEEPCLTVSQCAIDKFRYPARTDWNKSMSEKLDDATRDWIDSLPAHRKLFNYFPREQYLQVLQVRWDPNRKNQLHFTQSIALRIGYYTVQIITHQPFIGSSKSPSLSASCADICSGAARACVHLIDSTRERLGMSMRHFIVGPKYRVLKKPCSFSFQGVLFLSAVCLLKSIWQEQKDPDHSVEMKDVYTCMDILSSVKNR